MAGWAFVVVIALWLVYVIATEAMFGATVGKLLTGIRVVGAGGERIGLKASVVRNALRVVDGFPYAVPYFVGWIVTLTDKVSRRRVGDRVAKTYVVLKGIPPLASGPPPVPPMPPLQ